MLVFPISFFPFLLLQLCCHFINLFHEYFLWNFHSLLTTIHLVDCISSFLSLLFVPCSLTVWVWVFFHFGIAFVFLFPIRFPPLGLLLVFNLSLPTEDFSFLSPLQFSFFMSQNFGTLGI